MAASRAKHFQSILTFFNTSSIRWKDSGRTYSQYAPHFQEPIVSKTELDKLLEEKDKVELECKYLKAAKNSETSSVFYDADLQKFINYIMRKGRKDIARELVEKAFIHVKHHQIRQYNKETDEEKRKEILIRPLDVFHLAVKNTTPVLDVRKVKKSGTWYQVPVGITDKLAKFYAMRWLVEASNEKSSSTPFEVQLAQELLAASRGEGKAFNKKISLHKLCEANRGYAHYKFT